MPCGTSTNSNPCSRWYQDNKTEGRNAEITERDRTVEGKREKIIKMELISIQTICKLIFVIQSIHGLIFIGKMIVQVPTCISEKFIKYCAVGLFGILVTYMSYLGLFEAELGTYHCRWAIIMVLYTILKPFWK